jgi:CXXX repeat modification system protein
MELRKLVGQVTPEECLEIQVLYERRNGLKELANILTVDNTELYEKLIKDMGDTTTKFQNWWNDKEKKYGWESHPNGSWEINFQTCEITLVVNKA